MAPRSPAVSLDWREGRYFDLWMLVHFACGVAGGFSNVFFALSAVAVYIVATVVMTLWEVLEFWQGVKESWSNRGIDIVVGLLGVHVSVWLAAPLSHRGRLLAFAASLALAVTLSALGWIAYRRRTRAKSAT